MLAIVNGLLECKSKGLPFYEQTSPELSDMVGPSVIRHRSALNMLIAGGGITTYFDEIEYVSEQSKAKRVNACNRVGLLLSLLSWQARPPPPNSA